MKIEVLIPTHHKTKEQIRSLCEFLNLQSDAVFANQNGTTEDYAFYFKTHYIRVICTKTIGVSKNRNILLNNATGDICLFIDDDCPLVNEYGLLVKRFYLSHKADVVFFNGIVVSENNRLIHTKKTKKVKSILDVSYGGGPGLSFADNCLKNNNLYFDENVGFPNKIYLGEDTLFLKKITQSKLLFFRSDIVLFKVQLDKEENSTYFKGFEDRYFISKGYIYKRLFPVIYWLVGFYYSIKYARMTHLKMRSIRKLFRIGYRTNA